MYKSIFSFIAGFILLFVVYHFPEFFSAFWIMAVFKIGFLAVAFFLARWQGWKGLGAYGLSIQKGWWLYLLNGWLTGIFFFSLSVLLAVIAGFEVIISIEPVQVVLKQLPLILLMTVFPSIAEDILTRGYLFGHLKNKLKPFAWIFISSAVYVLNHIWRLADDPSVLAYLFILGLVLAYTVWQTKSLWAALGIHWGANIAFESGKSLYTSHALVNHNGSTWLLALCWLLLLLIFLFVYPVQDKPKIKPGHE
ncbi:MAG: CPBP family intramembrane metalloprotease [Bacteroidetes bacterium]|nr:CPBP family intramembrane metalloprotease [Bacteroidota bacterium]